MPLPDHRRPTGRTDMPRPRSRAAEDGPITATSHPAGDGRTVIEVCGDVDYATVPQLRESISSALDQQPAVIVLDLAGVTVLDSAGVGTLAVAYRICAHLGVRLQVRDPSPFVVELLRAAGVADRLID